MVLRVHSLERTLNIHKHARMLGLPAREMCKRVAKLAEAVIVCTSLHVAREFPHVGRAEHRVGEEAKALAVTFNNLKHRGKYTSHLCSK